MAQSRNSLKIDIDLSKLYDGEPPMSAGAKSRSRRVRSATARSDRPRQKSVTGRGGRVAARTARDKRAVSARCPTKTESLIILFQARKRRLYNVWENGFEDPEHPVRESPLSPGDRQSKKVDISRSLANIKLAETSDSKEKRRRSRSGVKSPNSTVSASRGFTKDATQNDNGNSNLNSRKQAKDQPTENNRSVDKPFGRVYAADISTSMRTRSSLSLKHATSARNYDISRDHALRESEHALRIDGGNPGSDGSTRGRTPGFVPTRHPRRSSASRNADVTQPQEHKPSRESSSTRERVGVKVQSTSRSVDGKRHSNTRPRSSYEKLLHYLTLVGDYPEEFEKLRRLTANVSHSPAHSLLRIGRAFTSGHRHFGRRETPVQLAAYELGCRQRHSACATVTPKSHPMEYSHIDSEIADEDLDGAAARLPGLRQMLEEQGMVAAELWLARRDAQKAVASVSTRQSLREREKALHALGEAEGSLQQWWVAQKDCRYLRV